MPTAIASRAASAAESDALSSVSALDPDAVGGLGSAMSAFYASLRAVSQNPAGSAERQAAVSATQELAPRSTGPRPRWPMRATASTRRSTGR